MHLHLSRENLLAAYAALREVEPFTRDGTRVTVLMNAGLRDDMPNLSLTGADGVGLFRTEFQFLVSATLPARERQTRLYRDVLDAAGDKPVVFRTVDIGGDKVLPYLRHNNGEHEENPAMGWRALRVALERDGLLKVQARSLLEAAAGRMSEQTEAPASPCRSRVRMCRGGVRSCISRAGVFLGSFRRAQPSGSSVPLLGIRSCNFRVRRGSGSDVHGDKSFV